IKWSGLLLPDESVPNQAKAIASLAVLLPHSFGPLSLFSPGPNVKVLVCPRKSSKMICLIMIESPMNNLCLNLLVLECQFKSFGLHRIAVKDNRRFAIS